MSYLVSNMSDTGKSTASLILASPEMVNHVLIMFWINRKTVKWPFEDPEMWQIYIYKFYICLCLYNNVCVYSSFSNLGDAANTSFELLNDVCSEALSGECVYNWIEESIERLTNNHHPLQNSGTDAMPCKLHTKYRK